MKAKCRSFMYVLVIGGAFKGAHKVVEGLKGIRLAVIGGDDRELYLIPELQKQGAYIVGVGFEKATSMDTRFGKAEDWKHQFEEITGNKSIYTSLRARLF